MGVLLFLLAVVMVVSGGSAVYSGSLIISIERGWAMVIAGSVCASAGAVLLGLAVVAGRLGWIGRQTELLGETMARIEMTTWGPPPALPIEFEDDPLPPIAPEPAAPRPEPPRPEPVAPRPEPAASGPGPATPPEPAALRPEPPASGLEPATLWLEPELREFTHPESALREPAFVEPARREPDEPEPEILPPSGPIELGAPIEPAAAAEPPPEGGGLAPDAPAVDDASLVAAEPPPDAREADEGRTDEPPEAEPSVIGSYSAGPNAYLMFSDGSIQADTPEGRYRFASLEELKDYVAEGERKAAESVAPPPHQPHEPAADQTSPATAEIAKA